VTKDYSYRSGERVTKLVHSNGEETLDSVLTKEGRTDINICCMGQDPDVRITAQIERNLPKKEPSGPYTQIRMKSRQSFKLKYFTFDFTETCTIDKCGSKSAPQYEAEIELETSHLL